ncbi:MAG: hypothetical protein GXP38_11990 [Chloroflexi bacterium]|nr:hypothetical protein [Chloroflexota bacterium]
MQQVSSRTTFLHALALVSGFTLVFTLLGASVGLLGGYALYDVLPIVVRVGAILLVVFALKVAHLRINYLGWALIAFVLAAITYWLDRFQFDPSIRVLHAVVIGLTVLSGAKWDKMVLLGLAVIIGVLSWLSSGTLNVAWRVIETFLVVVIVYGGNVSNFFDQELRLDVGNHFGEKASYLRSGLVGVIFAAGWTPCVGPILSGILLMAAGTETVSQGAILLLFYSIGLGIPFLLAGALFSRLTSALPRFYRWLPAISVISGALLIIIALLIFTDSLAQLAQFGTFLNIEQGLASEGSQISLLIALIAGIISFLSPCVLPLVPAYLGYLSGAALSTTNLDASQQAA